MKGYTLIEALICATIIAIILGIAGGAVLKLNGLTKPACCWGKR